MTRISPKEKSKNFRFRDKLPCKWRTRRRLLKSWSRSREGTSGVHLDPPM